MVWLTDAALRHRSGTAYERGVWCVSGVEDLVVDGDTATASVRSQSDVLVRYRVRVHGPEPAGECDCPQGLEGRFCKHCVAVGLRVLGFSAAPGWRSSPPPVDEWPAVLGFLGGRSAPELAALLEGVARDDPAIRHRLWLLATAETSADTSAAAPASLDDEVRVLERGYGAGGGARYAERVRAAAFALAHLPVAAAAPAAGLLQLTITHAMAALTADADDTDDHAPDDDGPVRDAVASAWQAYLRLCAATPPPPDRLAAWFVALRLRHPAYQTLFPAADLTGVPGALTACRAELDGRDDPTAWSLHDEVLRALGDTDAHVAFLAADLSTYARYARIADLLDAAGRTAEALTWLERARRPATPPRDDPRPVVDLLARLYTRQGRLDDALQVRRRHFATARTERAFRLLREAARHTDWPPLRAWALDVLRQAPATDPDTLVRILVEEGETDEAWQVARLRHCDEDTMLVVARARATTHPADAIPVYRARLEGALRCSNGRDRNRAYDRAADLMLVLRDLVTRSGGSFPQELAAFKRTHGRKTNLMAALARRGM